MLGRLITFDTSIADFRNIPVDEKRQVTVTIQKLRYSENLKDLVVISRKPKLKVV